MIKMCQYSEQQYYNVIKKRFDIGTVICPRAFVLARGRRTRTNNSANIESII